MRWDDSYRIVRTIYPPVDLFEDIAPQSDWDMLAAAARRSDPAGRDIIGKLALVPTARRVAGPTASIAMAPFLHMSRARPSRFSDGTYGVWYCGDRCEVALAETAYHFERFMRATDEPAGSADYNELRCAVQATFLEAPPECLAPDDWRPGQRFGRTARTQEADGIIYNSVRHPAGLAAALFWPDCIVLPVRKHRQLRYHWNGSRMSKYLVHGTREWIACD